MYWIFLRIGSRAACQFLPRAHGAGAGSVDVDVLLVVGIDAEGVRVRAAARLDRGELFGFADVRDVEHAHAAKPLRADGRLDSPGATVDASTRLLDRHEQQIAVHRKIPLAARTDN